ncbi:hypothetical protein THAOC_30405, partial [Thalassiosira oceanica]
MSETNEGQTGADVEVKKTNEDPEDVGVEEAPAPEEAPDAVAEKASLGVALDANQ